MAKVLHISTVRQGLEVRAFHHECRALHQHGFDVSFLVHNGPDDVVADGIRVRTLGLLRTHRRGLLPFARARALWRAFQISRAEKPDLVHLHDPELIPLGLWVKVARGCRVVYDSAENYSAYALQKHYLPRLVRWMLFALIVVLEKFAGWWFDAIITADESTTELLRSRGAKRVLTLHNFPSLSLFRNQLIEDSSHDSKEYDLVYHGSVPKYHLEIAFEIATELKQRGTDIRWLIFGAVDDLDWALQEIQRRELGDNFTIEGSVDHSEVPSLVCAAKIGVIPLPDLPKFQHNIPMKLFEFMALEMPVVLSDLPPSRPFVGDQECALMVPPGDAKAFADAIECLLADSQLRDRMGTVGRAKVEREFNWETESSKLSRLYRELLQHAAAAKREDTPGMVASYPRPPSQQVSQIE